VRWLRGRGGRGQASPLQSDGEAGADGFGEGRWSGLWLRGRGGRGQASPLQSDGEAGADGFGEGGGRAYG